MSRTFGVEFPDGLDARYNIAPSQPVAAIRTDEKGKPEPVMLRWGLVPFWAKDAKIGHRMINARRETLKEKPAYRAAFKCRRCVILADGFYEWRKTPAGKTPYFITTKNAGPFGMAGLWEQWQQNQEPVLETCTIITTEAAGEFCTVHHRMPVILTSDQTSNWLGAGDVNAAAELLSGAGQQVDTLEYWPVSRRVNNPANDTPDLINTIP